MVLTDLKLWHVDLSQRALIESSVCDLFLENGGEDHSGPVTVCHINFRVGGRGRRKEEEETCGRALRRGRRPAPNGETFRPPNGVRLRLKKGMAEPIQPRSL